MTSEQSRKLVQAAHKGTMDTDLGVKFLVTELIRFGVDLDWNEKPFHRSALFEAVLCNQEPVLKFLAEKGCDVNKRDYRHRTPLQEAASFGYDKIVDALLERKADVMAKDTSGRTALFCAVQNRRGYIAKALLLHKCDPNVVDKDGLTVGHLAAFQGESAQTWWLYCQGARKNRFALEDTEDLVNHAGDLVKAAEGGGTTGGEVMSPTGDTPSGGGDAKWEESLTKFFTE